ncbi:MAG: hypothetical protein JSV84_04135 [Gemmatimonadota bacterium]|nr:MAG: hypothetical protein JSV84_04135 [Gemmatimonadota bacterium]
MLNKLMTLNFPHVIVTLFLVTSAFGNAGLTNTSGIIVDIRNIGHRNWEMASFSLDKKLDLHIEARGTEPQRDDFVYSYAWILDARSRDVVWEMNLDKTSRKRRLKKFTYERMITLSEGDYEVYYATSTFFMDMNIEGLGDLFESIIHGLQDKRYTADRGITIKAKDSRDMKYVHEYDPHKRDKNVILQMTCVGDDEFHKEGFTLKKPAAVRIYALGEGSLNDREMSDYGWIMNTKTRERIWEMTTRNTDHAGGADKNLLYNDRFTLPAGSYMVSYVTDGSHSYERWNARPPYDPNHWGITLWSEDSSFIQQDVVPHVATQEKEPVIKMVRMQDDEFRSQGFSLLKPADLHIYALGEYASDTFYDYGIILDAHTREKVWSMTFYNTKHAGGGKKNRIHDDIVRFPAGDYIVYYITDESHSLHEWNAGPPYDPEAWGITIWVAEDNFEPNSIQKYTVREDPNVLTNLTGLGDQEQGVERFSLDQSTRVRIYAVGEGDRYDMYDYGWNEDERGRMVWEMTYRNTGHAGGAQKNRLFNDVIVLGEGEYTVHFVTDGSHSFKKWNSTPPYDPFHWGILVMKEE